MTNKIGIVSVSYNSAAVIEDFLTSLNAQIYTNWHLYLIDNASGDETADIVTNHLNQRICWIPQQYNTGFARGSNIGIKQAIADNCDNILLINNDVEFKPDFLFMLLKELEKGEADIVAPKIYYYHPKNRIWSAGGGFKPDNAWAAYHRGLGEVETG